MAVVPSAVLKQLLEDNWETTGYVDTANLREPGIYDVNTAEGRAIRLEPLYINDIIRVMIDIPAEEETPIGSWVYGNRIYKFIVEIWTEQSRQRLYDMRDEIRRIIHANMHSLTEFQRLRYANFNEYINDNANIWAGRISIEGINNAVLLETTND